MPQTTKKNGVVAQVRAIAARMRKAKPADVILACAERGINPFTARTQVHQYRAEQGLTRHRPKAKAGKRKAVKVAA